MRCKLCGQKVGGPIDYYRHNKAQHSNLGELDETSPWVGLLVRFVIFFLVIGLLYVAMHLII